MQVYNPTLSYAAPIPFDPNPLHLADSYKNTHFYEAAVQELLAYFESRGGEFPYTQFFGLQGLLIEHFIGKFFTLQNLNDMQEDTQAHFYEGFPFHYDDWKYILDKYDGRLPVEIRAVKEGSIVPVSNVLYTVRSTDQRVPGIGQWMETVLQHAWYGTTVATKDRMCKELFRKFLEETADTLAALPFQLHDFGFRGVECVQAAGRGGAAHGLNFLGSDTMVGMDYLHQYYGAPRVSMYSVPATEHSMFTIKGRAGEAEQVGAALRKYPKGIISLVGDSYNIFNFAKEILGREFRDLIRAREGKVVCRPDSGDPTTQVPQLFDIFAESFGTRENGKGYKVLAPCIGTLWGDGMDLYSIHSLLRAIKAAHWSTENIVCGMGGGLLQKLNRDTQKFAIKLCNAVIDGKEIPVSKDPVTDKGKASKGGRLVLLKQDRGRWATVVNSNRDVPYPFDRLETVFLNGEMKRFQNVDEIRKIADEQGAEYAQANGVGV
jgi:nicotinamide phosphoribosyltransferase